MIKVINKNRGQRGLQRIEGYVNDSLVIVLNDGILRENEPSWSVAMSSCLPSGIEEAKKQVECINLVFEALEL